MNLHVLSQAATSEGTAAQMIPQVIRPAMIAGEHARVEELHSRLILPCHAEYEVTVSDLKEQRSRFDQHHERLLMVRAQKAAAKSMPPCRPRSDMRKG